MRIRCAGLLLVCWAALYSGAMAGPGAPGDGEYSGEYVLPSGGRVSVLKEGVVAERVPHGNTVGSGCLS